MTLGLQELIELEARQAIGAGRYERTDERTTHGNVSRSCLLSTNAGDVELRIPKLRAGSFLPTLLEPRRRIDRAVEHGNSRLEAQEAKAECRAEHERGSGAGDGSRTRDIQLGRPKRVSAVAPCLEARA
jgi:hypothetical protein